MRAVNEKAFTPESILETFNEYVKWVKDNPIKISDWVGGVAKQVVREKERPLTMEGFEIYVHKSGGISDLAPYFANREDRYCDFTSVCRRIRTEIRCDQIEGGMAGIYHHNITARLNGLSEKTESNNEQVTAIRIIYTNKPIEYSKNKQPFYGDEGNEGYYEIESGSTDVCLPLFPDIEQ
jgi:hypothetical protein